MAALLTAAEEGDEHAREEVSAAWVVRLPLALFHDGDEDWRSRREHVHADVVGFTADGEVQVQPVGRVVGRKVRGGVGGQWQRAAYTQWEVCALTWRELRGERRYGKHRVACKVVYEPHLAYTGGSGGNAAAPRRL